MALSRTFNLLGALVAAIVLSLAVIGCSFEREPEQGPEEPEFTVGTDSDDLDDAVKAIRSVTDFQPRVGFDAGPAQQSSDEMIALVTATVVRIGAEG